MNLHEYQSKELFLNAGIPILKGAVALSSIKAKTVAEQLGGDVWVIKAQVHSIVFFFKQKTAYEMDGCLGY